MGSFCSLIKSSNANIPVTKQEEFLHRIGELFYRGGMFDWDYYILFGKEYLVLKRAMPYQAQPHLRYQLGIVKNVNGFQQCDVVFQLLIITDATNVKGHAVRFS